MQGGDVKFLNEEHSHKSLSYVKQPVTKSVRVCVGGVHDHDSFWGRQHPWLPYNHIMLTGSSRIKKQHTFLTKTAQVLHFHLWKNFISLSKSVKSDTLIDAIANLNVSACNSEIMFFV